SGSWRKPSIARRTARSGLVGRDIARPFSRRREPLLPALVAVVRGLGLGFALLAPLLGPAIAQPEDAGMRVRRQVHRVLLLPGLAVIVEELGGRLLEAGGARIERGDDGVIRDRPALAHRLAELGDGGDPVVDGAAGNPQPRGKRQVGRALGAGLAGDPDEFGLIKRKDVPPAWPRSSMW